MPSGHRILILDRFAHPASRAPFVIDDAESNFITGASILSTVNLLNRTLSIFGLLGLVFFLIRLLLGLDDASLQSFFDVLLEFGSDVFPHHSVDVRHLLPFFRGHN